MSIAIQYLTIINDLDFFVYIECTANSYSGSNNIINAPQYTSLGLLPGEKINLSPIVNTLSISDRDSFTITIRKAYPTKDDEETFLGSCTYTYSTISNAIATIRTSQIDPNNIIGTDYSSMEVKRIELHAVNGLMCTVKFRVHYLTPGSKDWNEATSKTFSLGSYKFWDCIDELHLPDMTRIRVGVCSIAADKVIKEQLHPDVLYVRRTCTTTRKYKCTGTVSNPKISRK